MPANQFDAFASAYATDNERNAWNAYYERPAILALAGKVDGLRVLDAGCGGGAHAMFDALKQAGFQVETLSEPQPDPQARELFPAAYESLTTAPRFLFFSCKKIQPFSISAKGHPTASTKL